MTKRVTKTATGFFKSITGLCKTYGLNRNTFYRFSEKPGFPKKTKDGWPGKAILEFIKSTSTTALKGSDEYTRLRNEKLIVEINLKQLEFRKRDNEVLEVSEMKAYFAALAGELRRSELRLETEGSALGAGMDKVNLRQFLQRWNDKERERVREVMLAMNEADDFLLEA
jgi:predicted DNA-binding transcriptional regulator AlpA